MMHVDWSTPSQDDKPRPRRRSQSQSGIRGIWSSLTGVFKDDSPGSSNSHQHHHQHQRSDSKHSSSRSRPPPSRSNSKPSTSNPSSYTTQVPRGGTVIVVHHRRPSTPRVQVIQASPTPRRQQTAPPGYNHNYVYVSAPPTPQRRPSHPAPNPKMPSGNRTEGGTKVLADADIINEYMTSQTNVQKWLKKQAAMGY